ncbi:hypothetical protein [Roseateles sp. BYS87W]|uniref:Uncharacterized protein n=1 Tax=Pelomonas baiyunensis TaxID=3299026 RepID=A0ABW7H0C0_9BURK
METIAKHRKKLLEPYTQSSAAADIVASAKHLAHLVLASDRLLHRHKKKMLSEVLWLISEADGKYSTRYRSVEVVRLAQCEPTSTARIQHEHVFPRKRVTESILRDRERLLADPALLDTILEQTVGCVVTVDEHKALCDHEDGWRRYSNVPVLDMATSPPSIIHVS